MLNFLKKSKKVEAELEGIDKLLKTVLSIVKDISSNVISPQKEDVALEEALRRKIILEMIGIDVNFSLADQKDGKPPHYLVDLDEEDRKSFVSEMEVVYSNKSFNKVIEYMINLFATKSIMADDPKDMKKFQHAMFAFRVFLQELDKRHEEFLSYKKDDEQDFDPQEILPS